MSAYALPWYFHVPNCRDTFNDGVEKNGFSLKWGGRVTIKCIWCKNKDFRKMPPTIRNTIIACFVKINVHFFFPCNDASLPTRSLHHTSLSIQPCAMRNFHHQAESLPDSTVRKDGTKFLHNRKTFGSVSGHRAPVSHTAVLSLQQEARWKKVFTRNCLLQDDIKQKECTPQRGDNT